MIRSWSYSAVPGAGSATWTVLQHSDDCSNGPINDPWQKSGNQQAEGIDAAVHVLPGMPNEQDVGYYTGSWDVCIRSSDTNDIQWVIASRPARCFLPCEPQILLREVY
jgi:hypothetical protein